MPASSGVVQVWHTPVRQLQRVLMSQASASSSTLLKPVPNGVEMPLRAKVTSGPVPGGPAGRCGERWTWPTTPGLTDASAPNSSVRMRDGVDAEGGEGLLDVGHEP